MEENKIETGGENGVNEEVQLPVSLRDYFAGQALISQVCNTLYREDLERMAKVAYAVADAMIKERNKI